MLRNIFGLRDREKLIVEKYFRNGGNRILDIGCGTGREAMALAKLGYKVSGIDISEKEIEIAKGEAQKEKLKIEYKLCNGIDLEFENDYFDYSIIWTQTLDKNMSFVLSTYLNSNFDCVFFLSVVLTDKDIRESIIKNIEAKDYEIIGFTLICSEKILCKRHKKAMKMKFHIIG